jgi:OPT family oligopeptide transporter
MIKELTPKQVREWTLEQKDKWWLANVWRGDMPQLTLRSGLTGMLLGGILSLTNLYVGIKTGWTLGVGITSVILSFALWKALARFHMGSEMTLLENNAMQSIATAAGYMTGPLISSMTAYMIVTGKVVPLYQTFFWIIFLSLLGVLFAFPLKKRFINDEQHPFPEGKACGIVMDGLHSEDEEEGRIKTRLLVIFGLIGALWKIITSQAIMAKIHLGFLALPHFFDDFLYKFAWFQPSIMGTRFRDLTIRLETDIVMFAVGGLIGIRTGWSLIIGAAINYLILAPVMIDQGAIMANDAGAIGFREITKWSVWGGVAMMTTASLFSFFSKPRVILTSFKGMFSKNESEDVLKDIELPMKVFVVGIPVIGLIVVLMAHHFFNVHYWLGALAVPLVFVFTLIAVNSTALTAITPTGALGKLTQLTFAALAPGNIKANIMTAGITGEVASNASNLLMDIKPGYMLGAKPRHQAMGHVLGIIAGGFVATPIFYWMFAGDISRFGTETMPMISAQIWVAVAEVLTKGLSGLHPTAVWAMAVGGLIGIVLEAIKTATKGKFFLSGVGIGLAFVIPFFTCLSMFLGAFFFWLVDKVAKNEGGWWRRIGLKNQETICAGLIAGGAIMGIIAILVELNLA